MRTDKEIDEYIEKNKYDTDISFGGKKGYEFKLKTPTDIHGMIKLFDAFTEAFKVSFTLEEEAFKKIPKDLIVEGSVKEVNNLL